VTDGHTNGILLVRVAHRGRVGYVFVEVTDFDLEYWRGHTERGEFALP
jgi:hypothetical protein